MTFFMYMAAVRLFMACGYLAGLPTLMIMMRRQFVALPLSTLVIGLIQALSGRTTAGWFLLTAWLVLFGVLMAGLPRLMPARFRAWWLRPDGVWRYPPGR